MRVEKQVRFCTTLLMGAAALTLCREIAARATTRHALSLTANRFPLASKAARASATRPRF